MKGSIEKNKNTIDRKNPNYFTGTNMTSFDDFKTTAKKAGTSYPENGKSSTDDPDVMKTIREKSTKISSKIEGDSNFKVKNQSNIEDKISKIKNFDIKNVLFAHLQRKQNELIANKEIDESDSISDAEGDDETDEKKKNKHELNANSAELEEMDADDIQVVKKGMKIKVKKETKFNEAKDTPYEDIIVKKDDPEEQYHHFINKHVEEEPPKTTVKPYNLTREMILNEILLEGIVDKEDPEDEEGAKVEEKTDENKTADALNNSLDDEDAQSEVNFYLEKFKCFYRSNMIATGTISIVLTQKNIEKVTDIPNPCAESYGAIIVDDGTSETEEDTMSKGKVNDKQSIRRNETIIPGGLMRSNTNTSKGKGRNSRVARRFLQNKTAMKKRVRDEEEYSEDNVLKKLILDVPQNSAFVKKVDKDQFKKDQEEDAKLNEGEEDDKYSRESEDEIVDIEDVFLDREIDFDVEIDRA